MRESYSQVLLVCAVVAWTEGREDKKVLAAEETTAGVQVTEVDPWDTTGDDWWDFTAAEADWMSCFSVAMAAAALDDCGCSDEVIAFA